MSQQTLMSYVTVREKIKAQNESLRQLRAEEKLLQKEIQAYLNQTDDAGIRLDSSTIITLASNSKRINKSGKAYKESLQTILRNRGLSNVDKLVEDIVNAKIDNTIKHQHLRILKIK